MRLYVIPCAGSISPGTLHVYFQDKRTKIYLDSPKLSDIFIQAEKLAPSMRQSTIHGCITLTAWPVC